MANKEQLKKKSILDLLLGDIDTKDVVRDYKIASKSKADKDRFLNEMIDNIHKNYTMMKNPEEAHSKEFLSTIDINAPFPNKKQLYTTVDSIFANSKQPMPDEYFDPKTGIIEYVKTLIGNPSPKPPTFNTQFDKARKLGYKTFEYNGKPFTTEKK